MLNYIAISLSFFMIQGFINKKELDKQKLILIIKQTAATSNQ